jgi:hypothetical protein
MSMSISCPTSSPALPIKGVRLVALENKVHRKTVCLLDEVIVKRDRK